MKTNQLFGTDGIRGRAGEHPLTEPFSKKIGNALAEHLWSTHNKATPTPAVIIGHDGRASGESLTLSISKGLTEKGVDVDIVGLAPTPCVAYLASAIKKYSAGIVVSASHNPAEDNGIKILDSKGEKITRSIEKEIERCLGKDISPPQSTTRQGIIKNCEEATKHYVNWLRLEAFPNLDLSGVKILVDCANGAASTIAGEILDAFGAEATLINASPDGTNINKKCGATHPNVCAKKIQEGNYEIGLSLDGDADRSILCDSNARIMDGDLILAGLATMLSKELQLKGDTVVATTMSNLALEKFLEQRDLKLIRTDVGDKYVTQYMKDHNLNLGGEKSGHILFGDIHNFRGDGMFTLLQIMKYLSKHNLSSAEFAKGYCDYPQKIINLSVTHRCPMKELINITEVSKKIETSLKQRGRAVIRFSGTELLLRLMVEADSESLVDESLKTLINAAKKDGILTENF